MDDAEFNRAVDGLMAYDLGSTDSGIHDPELKARLKVALAADGSLKRLARYAREAFLSDAAMEQGYGLEDVRAMFDWLSEYMEYDV